MTIKLNNNSDAINSPLKASESSKKDQIIFYFKGKEYFYQKSITLKELVIYI